MFLIVSNYYNLSYKNFTFNILDESPIIIEISLNELFFGSEKFIGMIKIFEKFFDTIVQIN